MEFRDQTTPDLFDCKDPVRQGTNGVQDGNPGTCDPSAGKREGSEFDYLGARRDNSRIAAARRMKASAKAGGTPPTRAEPNEGGSLVSAREWDGEDGHGSRSNPLHVLLLMDDDGRWSARHLPGAALAEHPELKRDPDVGRLCLGHGSERPLNSEQTALLREVVRLLLGDGGRSCWQLCRQEIGDLLLVQTRVILEDEAVGHQGERVV